MKIDTNNGSISFELGCIDGHLKRSDFKSGPFASTAREQVTNAAEGWCTVSIEPERGISAGLMFRHEVLRQVFILMAIPADEAGDWTMPLELERKSRHDAWLRSELGEPPYEYPWGSIASEFDAKGCVSEIIVTYAR